MYFVIIANDTYPDETYTSDIYYRQPTLQQIYDKFGDAEEMKGLYYKWSILVKKITNFQSISHVSSLQYEEDGYCDEHYVVGGDGYLKQQHEDRLEEQEQEQKDDANAIVHHV